MLQFIEKLYELLEMVFPTNTSLKIPHSLTFIHFPNEDAIIISDPSNPQKLYKISINPYEHPNEHTDEN